MRPPHREPIVRIGSKNFCQNDCILTLHTLYVILFVEISYIKPFETIYICHGVGSGSDGGGSVTCKTMRVVKGTWGTIKDGTRKRKR